MKKIHEETICVVGIGYIGLPTAAMFASNGYEVVGMDLNPHTVDELNKGKIVIKEPYLDDLVKHAVEGGMLRGTTAIEPADVFFIAVPTPIGADKSADLSYVEKACEAIASVLKKGDTVVLESTSPPGTTETLVRKTLEKSGLDLEREVYLAHSPERVIPGRILIELVENSRIVGGINAASAERVEALFRTFVKGPIFTTDATTAEMCKLMENTYRDVNIALANELAMICEESGVNAWEVRALSNHHPRVNIHMPGPGVGGHCIAVDPWFIVEKHREKTPLIHQARLINDRMPAYVAGRIEGLLGSLAQPKVALLGITYKPDVDDLRESPVLTLMEHLKDRCTLAVHDPFVEGYDGDLYQTCADADLVVLAVNHRVFEDIDVDRLYGVVRRPVVFDTRDAWRASIGTDGRFDYHLLGKASL